MLLLFGNINDTIYINDNVRTEINEYMKLFILNMNNEQIKLNTGELKPKVDEIYIKLKTEELKPKVDEIYNRLAQNY
jgi:hypothetical protein